MAESSDGPQVVLATATEAWPLDDDAAPLCAALAALGVRAEPRAWDDPESRWDDVALVVVRSTWNYALRREAFLAWSERVAADSTLCNPPAVLRWNTDKAYLHDLESAGIAIVPTRLVASGQAGGNGAAQVLHHAQEFADGGASEIVVKPSVSAGSKDTGRFDVEALDGALELFERIAASGRTTMIQPYLDAVDRVGETGLVYFDGTFSHTFEKGPLLSGGVADDESLFALERIAPRAADADERKLADAVVREAEQRFGTLLYARVDLLRDVEGSPRLLELELTEPSWFLDTDPEAAERAAAAIVARLGSASVAR